jgi:ankyrin repeat protein
MRGADINFINEINGFTPLHRAIENLLDVKVIKFLIKKGAYLHSEDKNGLDCCDKAQKLVMYEDVRELNQYKCLKNRKLR